MYIYICACIHIYIHIYIYICTCVFKYIYIHIYIGAPRTLAHHGAVTQTAIAADPYQTPSASRYRKGATTGTPRGSCRKRAVGLMALHCFVLI